MWTIFITVNWLFCCVILGMQGLFFYFVVSSVLDCNGNCCKIYTNSVDPDQMSRFAASDLILRCWPMLLLAYAMH